MFFYVPSCIKCIFIYSTVNDNSSSLINNNLQTKLLLENISNIKIVSESIKHKFVKSNTTRDAPFVDDIRTSCKLPFDII